MDDIETIYDSNDSEEMASKIKTEEIIILSDDEGSDNTKLDIKHVPITKVARLKTKKPSGIKGLDASKIAKKRKSSEADGFSKSSKRKCNLSEGECSKSVDKKKRNSNGKKMAKKDFIEVEIVDDNVDSKPPKGTEDIKESIMTKKAKMTHSEEMHMMWSEAELVADLQNIKIIEAKNVINLLDSENTIPFIARYRKELTGNMEPEKLRQVKNCYEHVKNIKHKANSAISSIAKVGKLTPDLEKSLRCSRTINEIEHIYAPFKSTKNRPLAERARVLGLGEVAEAVLHGADIVIPSSLIKPEVKGLEKIQDVITGIQNIIMDIISKDKEVLDFLRALRKELFLLMECSKARSLKNVTKAKGVKSMTAKQASQMKKKAIADAENKFSNYYNFSCNVNLLKPHQVLAINRGENLKILSVKISVPDYAFKRVSGFCFNLWARKGIMYPFRDVVLKQSIKEAYTKFLVPFLTRQVRSELLQNAEQAAIEVFASNLKSLLMAAPVRGKKILAIDPGFKNGCKMALISPTGDVLETCVIYPLNTHPKSVETSESSDKLKSILLSHQCEEIALGNGTACREVEEYLSNLIKSNWFRPLDIRYTIVSEQGASIYSCSPEAKKEFPDMDPNLISAVSLARRLQDPLAELVKIEPKHLGVGMYQHDVPEKQLSATLDEVVSVCASFVGVDINTASECILRRIAGLTSSKAANIIEYRSKNGLFQNRNQLKEVKSIGNKTFEQCAGFVRINPETFGTRLLSSNKVDFNPLDQTYIHPESYAIAHKVIRKCGLSVQHLGQTEFRNKVTDVVGKIGTEALSAEIKVPESQIQLIYEALQQPLNYDARSKYETPLFRREFKTFETVTVNSVLTGCVQNVTNFGVFVDIGVGRSGLIHSSSLQGMNPQNGQRVEVLVKSVDAARKRIGLKLIKIL